MDNIELLKSWIAKSKIATIGSKSAMGTTKSGKSIHAAGNKSAKGWSAEDHIDAYHAHREKSVDHREAMYAHPRYKAAHDSEPDNGTPEQVLSRISPHGGPGSLAVLNHQKVAIHHLDTSSDHYHKAKKMGWSNTAKKKAN